MVPLAIGFKQEKRNALYIVINNLKRGTNQVVMLAEINFDGCSVVCAVRLGASYDLIIIIEKMNKRQ